MPELVLNRTYFDEKRKQDRQEILHATGKAYEAVEIANRVLRLHFPVRRVRAIRSYHNNSELEPFLRPEHPPSVMGMANKMTGPIRVHIVVDVYFFFDGAYGTDHEHDAFVVEVAFPVEAQRSRWQCIARVRWADLYWERLGSHPGDVPVPHLMGETFVNDWA